jgi:hypothetical protein
MWSGMVELLALSSVDLVNSGFDPDVIGHVYEKLRKSLRKDLQISLSESKEVSWIHLMFLYGLRDEKIPHFLELDDSDGELFMRVEIDAKMLISSFKKGLLEVFFEKVILRSLIYSLEDFGVNAVIFKKRLLSCADVSICA